MLEDPNPNKNTEAKIILPKDQPAPYTAATFSHQAVLGDLESKRRLSLQHLIKAKGLLKLSRHELENLDPDEPAYDFNYANTCLQIGKTAFVIRKYDLAISYLDTAKLRARLLGEKFPGKVDLITEALLYEGKSHYQSGRYDHARFAFEDICKFEERTIGKKPIVQEAKEYLEVLPSAKLADRFLDVSIEHFERQREQAYLRCINNLDTLIPDIKRLKHTPLRLYDSARLLVGASKLAVALETKDQELLNVAESIFTDLYSDSSIPEVIYLSAIHLALIEAHSGRTNQVERYLPDILQNITLGSDFEHLTEHTLEFLAKLALDLAEQSDYDTSYRLHDHLKTQCFIAYGASNLSMCALALNMTDLTLLSDNLRQTDTCVSAANKIADVHADQYGEFLTACNYRNALYRHIQAIGARRLKDDIANLPTDSATNGVYISSVLLPIMNRYGLEDSWRKLVDLHRDKLGPIGKLRGSVPSLRLQLADSFDSLEQIYSETSDRFYELLMRNRDDSPLSPPEELVCANRERLSVLAMPEISFRPVPLKFDGLSRSKYEGYNDFPITDIKLTPGD